MSLPGQPVPGQTQAQPQVIQPTPGGYLVDFGDGNPTMVPEGVAVEHGLVNPTPGMYQQPPAPPMPGEVAPNLGNQQLQPPQVAPPQPSMPGAPVPGAGYSQSESQATSYRGIPNPGVAPTMPDLTGYDEQLAATEALRQKYANAQSGSYGIRGGLEVQKQDALAPMQAEIPRDVARQEKAMAAFDQVVNEKVEVENAKMAQRMAAIPQEDPGRIWQDKPAWQSALGLLSAVTGGMLAVTTGSGKNMGLEAIERAIQRDVEAQRTNIDSEFKKLAHDERALEAYRQWKSRDRANILEAGMLRRETLKYAISTEAAKYDSLSKKAEYAGLEAGLEAQNQVDHAAWIKELKNSTFAQAKEAYDQFDKNEQRKQVAYSNRTQRMNAETARMQAGPKPVEQKPLTPVHTFTGSDGKTTTYVIDPSFRADMSEGAIDQLRKDVVGQRNVATDLQEYRNLLQEIGRKYAGKGSNTRWGNEDQARARKFLQDLSSKWAKNESGASYAESYRLATMDMIGEVAGYTGMDPLKGQEDLIQRTMRRAEVDLNGRGVREIKATPGKLGPATEEGGNIPGQMRLVPFSGGEFNIGGAKTKDERSLGEQVKTSLVGITSSDPGQVLTSLDNISIYADADLATTHQELVNQFSMMEIRNYNGKTAILFPGDKGYKAPTSAPNAETAASNMRKFTSHTAMKAVNEGIPQAAQEIHQKASDLELFLRTGKLPKRTAPVAPGATEQNIYQPGHGLAGEGD